MAGTGLQTEGLSVHFGGLIAVDSVTLNAPEGRITGLIGPNGAGKSTTFNACSGLIRPTAGRVSFADRDVTALPPQRRARLGLGRTFQRMELFDSLTVRENVALGREAGLADARPWHHVLTSRTARDDVRDRADRAIDLCGIADLAGRSPADLSTGQRRLVELARVAAGGFRVLLLDEPSSGLDHEETRRFGDVLLHLVRDEGLGLLLVEHDMELVMRVCDYLYVLDFGKQVFEGTPSEVQASAVVRAAYLGDDPLDEALADSAMVRTP